MHFVYVYIILLVRLSKIKIKPRSRACHANHIQLSVSPTAKKAFFKNKEHKKTQPPLNFKNANTANTNAGLVGFCVCFVLIGHLDTDMGTHTT